MFGADVISGTPLDDWFLGTVAIIGGVATLAALAHKPPVKQLGHAIGWVFSRLIGEPLAQWYSRTFQERAEPIVRAVADAAIVPLRREVAELRDELRAHVRDENETEHAQAEWRAGVDLALRNLQQSHAPHTTAEPDRVDERRG